MSDLVRASIEDGVGRLRLTRPGKRNAINQALAVEALRSIRTFEQEGVTVAVLEADPPVFCSGADLGEATSDPEDPATEALMARIMGSEILWIAAVDGPALGAGMSLVAACPVAVCTTNAWFSLPEWQIGLFPTGVTAVIEPLIGARLAMTLGLTGEPMDAETAVRSGLVTEVVAPEQLQDRITWWTHLLTERERIVDAARRSWQHRFITAHHTERRDALQRLLEEQYTRGL